MLRSISSQPSCFLAMIPMQNIKKFQVKDPIRTGINPVLVKGVVPKILSMVAEGSNHK